MKYSILFAIGLALFLPLQADAKGGKGKDQAKRSPEQVFKKKDKDNDGMLTKQEFASKKKDPAKAAKRFARLDKNSDGKLSLAEFTAKKDKADKPKKGGGKKGGKKNK